MQTLPPGLRDDALDWINEYAVQSNVALTTADARAPDQPVISANDAFYALTGYGPDDVIGRNCRFLQCEETDRESVSQISYALKRRSEISIVIVNRRSNGELFLNNLYIFPIFLSGGLIDPDFFIGTQREVTLHQIARPGLLDGGGDVLGTMLEAPATRQAALDSARRMVQTSGESISRSVRSIVQGRILRGAAEARQRARRAGRPTNINAGNAD